MRRLFFDNMYIQESKDLIRKFHQVEKHRANPVMVPDKPWERSMGHNFGTVFHEDGVFRYWYQSYIDTPDALSPAQCAYAESTNGITWDKPDLGLIELAGSKKNNIVALDVGWINIVRDDHDPDPAKRFKMLYFGSGKPKPGTRDSWASKGGHWGWCVAWSPDRFHWDWHPDNPVYTAAADGGTLFGWDEEAQEYVAYLIPRIDPYERTVGRTASKDFIDWGETELIIGRDELDPPGAEFYPMTAFKYQDWYVGFIYALYCNPKDPHTRMRGFMDVQLAFSPDGRSWQRPNAREPVIPRGGRGSFDAGMVGPNNGLVETDGKIWFYYNAWTGEHFETKAYRYAAGHEPPPGLFEMGRLASGLGLAHLRQDGFVSMTAGEETGSLQTRIEKFSGAVLTLNAVTHQAGTIKAEIQTADGKPVKGYEEAASDPFRGDCLDHEQTWQGKNSSSLPAGDYRIRFSFHNADLYSYEL